MSYKLVTLSLNLILDNQRNELVLVLFLRSRNSQIRFQFRATKEGVVEKRAYTFDRSGQKKLFRHFKDKSLLLKLILFSQK